jgi:deazaflavin-dependent oxidoreductase (nitroreductase family)
MSHLHERNDRDVTASSAYDLNNRPVFKKQMEELNSPIIEEFRSHGGKVGGQFTGHNMLLLHTIGAKSHQPHVNPLGYMKDGDAFVIIASKGGAPTNPDWYHNLWLIPRSSWKWEQNVSRRMRRFQNQRNVIVSLPPSCNKRQALPSTRNTRLVFSQSFS